ncbi:TRAP transporter TatT component family protein [Desulfotalea psychrophila]|uniref:Lipoprotein n=1 Tax=Desulfotalea psychrophila (strain LSv54 / DSM 12343) TaxID=177439 RepID=Q6AR52_DESPS|nr:TRAP transporter TatT component family protein [Desulfotalea psychrophila]CAG35172.1 hypothetical protein DP0443 [Desulfotalea psychrophila LSv54]
MSHGKIFSWTVLTLTVFLLSSCARLITHNVVEPAVANIQQQTDIELVCEGAPAYLLMVDSMLTSHPRDEGLLRMASQAYIGYVGALGQCGAPPAKIRTNTDKTKLYAGRLLEEKIHWQTRGFELDQELAECDRSDVPELFWGSFGLLTWIQQQGGSPASMADLVVVEKTMQRILELDEKYQAGAAHLFFGGYYATKPEFLGGGPKKARYHLEKALLLSQHQFLLCQVTYARTYARLTFDQELHDRLLKEVLSFPIESAPQYALSNRIAQKEAEKLLDEGYFD